MHRPWRFPSTLKIDLQRKTRGAEIIIPPFPQKRKRFLPFGQQSDEPGVIFGSVDPDRRLVDDADQDRLPLVENAELFEPLGLLVKRLRRLREGKEEIAPVSVKTDMLVVKRGRVGQERLASVSRIRDHAPAEPERPSRLVEDDFDAGGVADRLGGADYTFTDRNGSGDSE